MLPELDVAFDYIRKDPAANRKL